jgi:hypothetical protein
MSAEREDFAVMCPITFAGNVENYTIADLVCVKESCAWWDNQCQQCLMVTIANGIKRINRLK